MAVSRRVFIGAGIVGGFAAASGTGLYLWGADEKDTVRSIINRLVGDFRMSDSHFAAFLDHLDTHEGRMGEMKFIAYRGISDLDPDNSLSVLPGRFETLYEDYERKVLSEFLTHTDYLQINPETESVAFIAGEACINPFAVFI